MSMADEDTEATGAIDTSDDNSGAAPVMSGPDDNSGQPAIPPANMGGDQQQQQAPQGGGQPGFDPKGFGPLAAPARGIKNIVSYLMGADAVHPDALDQAGAKVDPQGQMTAADRNLLAIDQAREQGGDQAAWQLLQANRVAYNAQTAFAKTALQGTQQKPPDLRAAVDAANKAQANVLDGSNVQFAAGHQGITATVTMAGSPTPQTINLTPQQFAQFLDVGGDGQWDKIMDHSAPATLQRIASSGGAPRAPQGATKLSQLQPLKRPQAPAQQAPDDTDEEAAPPQKTNFGSTPSTLNLSGSDEVSPPSDPSGGTGYDPQLQRRAAKMFPSVSQEDQRNAWMAAQEQREDELQNKVDVAKETGENRVRAARETGNSRVQAATITGEAKTKGWQYASEAKLKIAQAQLASKIAQQESTNANASQTRALKAIQTKMMSAQPLTPQEQSYLDTLPGAGQAGAQVTAPGQRPQAPAQQQAPQAPQGGQQKPPVQGAKLYKGQWYTRGPNGESVPVQ